MIIGNKSATERDKLEFRAVSQLGDIQYSIVGDGGYVVSLLALIQKTHGNMPKRIYVNKFNNDLPTELQVAEETLSIIQEEILVLGTSLFQLEMMTRIKRIASGKPLFVDVLSAKGNEETIEYYQTKVPSNRQYLIFIAVNPKDNIDNYLANFFNRLSECSVDIVVRHPLQNISDQELLAANGVLVWNGSMSIHQPILQQVRKLEVDLTFVECGFFPQSQYFYFDKLGVNDQSQLKIDDLGWVSTEQKIALEKVRRTFFLEVTPYSDSDYIFVPLQVPNDSNILKNSRFTSGMQEFIDYVEEKYSDEKIIFKAHPKDRMSSTYRLKYGKFSEEDSRSLIMSSKLVHGINSSVLYEAVLAGVPVVVEGECLLKHHAAKADKLLAAMVFRQFDIEHSEFDVDKIEQFSHLNYKDTNCEQG
jgi:capsule polysaccharide modification protein KpsS